MTESIMLAVAVDLQLLVEVRAAVLAAVLPVIILNKTYHNISAVGPGLTPLQTVAVVDTTVVVAAVAYHKQLARLLMVKVCRA